MGITNHLATLRTHYNNRQLQKLLNTFLTPQELKRERVTTNKEWFAQEGYTTARLYTADNTTVVALERADGLFRTKKILSMYLHQSGEYTSETNMQQNIGQTTILQHTAPIEDIMNFTQTTGTVLRQIWDADTKETRADLDAFKEKRRIAKKNKNLHRVLDLYNPAFLKGHQSDTVALYCPPNTNPFSGESFMALLSDAQGNQSLSEIMAWRYDNDIFYRYRINNMDRALKGKTGTAFIQERGLQLYAEGNVAALESERKRKTKTVALVSLLAAMLLARSCCSNGCGSKKDSSYAQSSTTENLEQRLDGGMAQQRDGGLQENQLADTGTPLGTKDDTYHLRVWVRKSNSSDPKKAWGEITNLPAPDPAHASSLPRINVKRSQEVYIKVDHPYDDQDPSKPFDSFSHNKVKYTKKDLTKKEIPAQEKKDYSTQRYADAEINSYLSVTPYRSITIAIPVDTINNIVETKFLELAVPPKTPEKESSKKTDKKKHSSSPKKAPKTRTYHYQSLSYSLTGNCYVPGSASSIQEKLASITPPLQSYVINLVRANQITLQAGDHLIIDATYSQGGGHIKHVLYNNQPVSSSSPYTAVALQTRTQTQDALNAYFTTHWGDCVVRVPTTFAVKK